MKNYPKLCDLEERSVVLDNQQSIQGSLNSWICYVGSKVGSLLPWNGVFLQGMGHMT